jgi:tRNA C32,U32 (ribose-2'-O)-methylase TrmJ
VTDTVVRQQLELRKSAADQAAREAQQRIDAALAAQKLVEAVTAANVIFGTNRQKAKGRLNPLPKRQRQLKRLRWASAMRLA